MSAHVCRDCRFPHFLHTFSFSFIMVVWINQCFSEFLHTERAVPHFAKKHPCEEQHAESTAASRSKLILIDDPDEAAVVAGDAVPVVAELERTAACGTDKIEGVGGKFILGEIVTGTFGDICLHCI